VTDEDFKQYYNTVLKKHYAKLLNEFDLPAFIEQTYPECNLRLGGHNTFRCRAVWRGRDSEPSCVLRFRGGKWLFKDYGAADDGSLSQTRFGDARNFLERVVGLSSNEATATMEGQLQVAPQRYNLPPLPRQSTCDLKDYRRVAKYSYHDETGKTVMVRFRYELFDDAGVRLDKQFPTMRRHEADWVWGLYEGHYQRNKRGQWVKRATGTWLPRFRAPVYHLDAVNEARARQLPVLIVDGEKDADALRALGYTSTCSPYGYGGWEDHHVSSLANSHVVVLRDNEAEAERLAAMLCERLLGVATFVRGVLAMPKPHKDVSDYLRHHTPEAFSGLVQRTQAYRT
jgi:5S rRNA maturation endonuclease (ribonuclease M5)